MEGNFYVAALDPCDGKLFVVSCDNLGHAEEEIDIFHNSGWNGIELWVL